MQTERPSKILTIDDIYHPEKKKIDFDAQPDLEWAWVDDRRFLARPRKDADAAWTLVDARSGEATPLYDPAPLRAAFAEAPRVEARNLSVPLAMVVLLSGTELYRYDGRTGALERLAAGVDAAVGATLSPDGRAAAFVKGRNLWVAELESGAVRRLTHEEDLHRTMGALDWVYQEEVYGRGDFRGHWWSPDSRTLAFLRLDERGVEEAVLVDRTATPPAIHRYPYPRPGAPNPAVRLGVVDAAGGAVRWIDLPEDAPDEPLIVRVDWTPDSAAVVYQLQDRPQRRLDLCRADRGGGASRRLLRETSPAWVAPADNPRWLDDGSFLWLSERTGWRHIHRVDPARPTSTAVTGGEWDVTALHGLDRDRGRIYFSATERSSISRHVYHVDLAGGAPTRLTTREGVHEAGFSPGCRWFLDRWSAVDSPPEMALHAADGAPVRVLTESAAPGLAAYERGTVNFFQTPRPDGVLLEAMLLKPSHFDPHRRYPVLCHVYGGPGRPLVRNAWGGSRLVWLQMLAERGCLVWIFDNHSASGKGVQSAWSGYGAFGARELADLEVGLDWLRGQRYIDPERLGLLGWSFGGFLTLYAMTRTARFRLGIAGAPVTDWRLYDSIYTERYLGAPAHNPEGYRQSSILEEAPRLHGRLLLVHGLLDDNVHLGHSVQLIDRLQQSGKDFETVFYPRSRHGLEDPFEAYHVRKRMTDFILENL